MQALVARSAPTDSPLTLLGRDIQVRGWTDALAGARRGASSLLEFAGEPGSGKTRLLTHLNGRARADGVTAIACTGAETQRAQPYGLFRPILRRVGVAQGAPSDAAAEEPDHLHRLVLAGLDRLDPDGGPRAFLFDDTHWADPQSLALLGRLLRDPPPATVMVLAYRPRQCTPQLAICLDSVAVGHERLELGPLSVAEIQALTGLDAGPAAERLHEQSQGVPGYALALRTSLRPADDGYPAETAPTGPAVPYVAELAHLTAEERAVVDVAAVAGAEFDETLAASVAGIEPSRCADVLDRLVQRDLLRSGPVDDVRMRFRHPAVRAAVYQAVPPGRRRRLHAAVADELIRRQHPPGVYAGHVARSAQPGDTSAVRVLLRAAQPIVATAPVRAMSWLGAASRLIPESDPLRLDVDLALARACILDGRLAEGRHLLQRLAVHPAGDGYRARLALTRVELDRVLGHPDEASALADLELSRMTAGAAAEVAVPLAVEALVCGVLRAAPDVRLRSERVRALVDRAAPDPELTLAVRVTEAFGAAYAGGIPAVLPGLGEIAVRLDALPDNALAAQLNLLGLFAWTELLLERDRDAARHFDRALRIAAQAGNAPIVPYLLAGRCHLLTRQGRFDQAEATAVEAARGGAELGMPSLVLLAESLRAVAVARRDGPQAARAVAEGARRLAREPAGDLFSRIARRLALRLRYESGDLSSLEASLVKAYGGPDLGQVGAGARPYWASLLADVVAADGRPDVAARWLAKAARLAAEQGLAGQLAYVRLAQARHLLAGRVWTPEPEPDGSAAGRTVPDPPVGEPATPPEWDQRLTWTAGAADPQDGTGAAARLAGAAVDAFAGLGWRPAEAAARLVLARALGDGRAWKPAEAQLAEVRRIAETTGSQPLLRSAVDAQRRIGGLAGRLADNEPHLRLGLTRREWEIVTLISSGAGNAEVADRLFVTVKTVESHLTRVFRKTGVTSRAALVARFATRAGVVPPS
ncbi:AAA family ATPase [Micromonospora sp. NBC_01655]|uniref:helix-turn-helix transcriptional regulator n=1 Tax=Micromonospora sp. NBC_01655 TaxID=2975983 RepID=UPI00224CEE9E|nr:LuxR family transcriptional regulator [Micromonospora sp. NBC_01655]MCX4471777.1 AAA family ATPase [Micromonospora sp. NBC_01655]